MKQWLVSVVTGDSEYSTSQVKRSFFVEEEAKLYRDEYMAAVKAAGLKHINCYVEERDVLQTHPQVRAVFYIYWSAQSSLRTEPLLTPDLYSIVLDLIDVHEKNNEKFRPAWESPDTVQFTEDINGLRCWMSTDKQAVLDAWKNRSPLPSRGIRQR